MNFEKAMVIADGDGTEYVIMSVIEENNNLYAFANKLDDENNEPTDEYCIFTMIDDEIELVLDKEVIDRLVPLFHQSVYNDLKLILNENK